MSNGQRNASQKVWNYSEGSTPSTSLIIVKLMKDTVKEAIEKPCTKVLEENLHSEIVINKVETYLDIITENDTTDLQNKLLTLNFH